MSVVEAAVRYRWYALGFAFVAQLATTLANQVIGPVAPLFQPELGISKAQVGIFASASFAGSWCVLLAAGFLTDRFGVRRMMSLGQLVAGALLLSMAVVVSFPQAVAVMFAVGLGCGAVNPAATKAIMDWFPPKTRATAMGIKQTGYPLAGVFMASLLPAVALSVGWRYAIALVGLLIISGGIATARGYPDVRRPFQPKTGRSGSRGALREVARNRYLWILGAISILLVTVQLCAITYMTLYFSEKVLTVSVPDEHTRLLVAGGFLAFCQVGGVLGRVVWGIISDRVFHGRRRVVLAIIAGLTATLSLVMANLGPGYPLWLVGAIVFAFGTTAVGYNGVYHTLAAETSGSRHAGTGVGLSMTLGQVGTVGGPPLFGYVLDVSGSYQTAWLFLAGLAALGTLIAAATARGEPRSA